MNDLDKEDIEALRVLAQSNLRCAKYAEKILESTEGVSSYSPEKPQEPTIGQENEPQNPPEPKGSVFAY